MQNRFYKHLRKPISLEEIKRLIGACWNTEEKIMVCLPLFTGIKLKELQKLYRDDFDFERNEILIGGAEDPTRRVYFGYHKSLTKFLQKSVPKHYTTLKRSERTIQIYVKNLGARAQIKHLTFTRLHQTFIWLAFNRGVPVRFIALACDMSMRGLLNYVDEFTKEGSLKEWFDGCWLRKPVEFEPKEYSEELNNISK